MLSFAPAFRGEMREGSHRPRNAKAEDVFTLSKKSSLGEVPLSMALGVFTLSKKSSLGAFPLSMALGGFT